MARISVQLMPEEYESYFAKNLSQNWRFELPRIMRSERLISRHKKRVLIEQSYFKSIADLWWSLSEGERDDWKAAGAVKNWSGWKLFLQDTSIRISRGLSGVSTPSELYQSWVGRFEIYSPGSSIEIVQPHPKYYWTARVVPGHYPLTEVVWVKEDFSLPLKIEVSYKSNLSYYSTPCYAKLYANIWSLYQGRDIYTPLEIVFDLQSDWKRVDAEVSDVLGLAISYDMWFEFSGVRGDFFFDNLVIKHNGLDWSRDGFCRSIDEEYSKGFFQVLRPWIPVDVPSGVSYSSDYSGV